MQATWNVTMRSPSETPVIRSYMPELDSIRGIAILLVLFFHGMAPPRHLEISGPGRLLFAMSQYGWIGVNLFFVLSGFLITGILLDNKGKSDYFRRFYFRRALRILPALYGMLAMLIIGGWISFRFLAASVLFLANFAAVLGVGLQYGPLWSLAVEEHFYMVWPLVVRLASDRTLIFLSATACVFSPFLRVLNFWNSPPPQHFTTLYTWFNLDGLFLGALLAIWLRMSSFRRHHLARLALPITAAGTAAFLFLARHPSANTALVTSACNLACTGLLSCMLLLGSSHWSFLIDRPILKFFGFISYGLYLVHVLAFRLSSGLFARQFAALVASGKPMSAALLNFVTGIALATGIAYLSRRSLEEKFLRIGYSSRRTPNISMAEAELANRPNS